MMLPNLTGDLKQVTAPWVLWVDRGHAEVQIVLLDLVVGWELAF